MKKFSFCSNVVNATNKNSLQVLVPGLGLLVNKKISILINSSVFICPLIDVFFGDSVEFNHLWYFSYSGILSIVVLCTDNLSYFISTQSNINFIMEKAYFIIWKKKWNSSWRSVSSIIKDIRTVTGLIQWTNTGELLKWFSNIKNNKRFVSINIVEFYQSITKSYLIKGIGGRVVRHLFWNLFLSNRLLSYLPHAFYSLAKFKVILDIKGSKPERSIGSYGRRKLKTRK